ncbi:hypothetical protein [Sporolactobacillus nakayamae]|nr:hypothetical protein [Sporolactobacillus nakayamae]
MESITLESIITRVQSNKKRNQAAIRRFNEEISTRPNVKFGRVRPKDPVEAKILSRFKNK